MTSRSLSLARRPGWRPRAALLLTGLLTGLAGACTLPGPQPAGAAAPAAGPELLPGIPNLPDVVAVLPFEAIPDTAAYLAKFKVNLSDSNDIKASYLQAAKSRIRVLADVEGHRGLFHLDLGDPELDLNGAFLRVGPAGGLDTVTDPSSDHRKNKVGVHVTLRLGTLLDTFAAHTDWLATQPGHPNAWLRERDGWPFGLIREAPYLGSLGLAALAPFETIIDYAQQRVVLIRLDAAGRRLADVPAYPPRWSAPLLDLVPGTSTFQRWWGVQLRIGAVTDSAFFDTGCFETRFGDMWSQERQKAVEDFIHMGKEDATLDSLRIAGRAFGPIKISRYGSLQPAGFDVLGYWFLRQQGVVGFNGRAHRFLLYR